MIEATDMAAAVRLLADHRFIGRGGVLEINEPALPLTTAGLVVATTSARGRR